MISNVVQQNFMGTVDDPSKTASNKTKKASSVKVGAIAGAAVGVAATGVRFLNTKGTPAGALLGAVAKAQPGKFAAALGIRLIKDAAITAVIGAGIGKIVEVIKNKKAKKDDVRAFQA
ncbi:hypothetical protein IKE67_02435 [bacterium]|nr:hypothetical protein [bacterium]